MSSKSFSNFFHDFLWKFLILNFQAGLGSSSFARHYSRNRFFFLFLQVIRCFSSLRSLLTYYFTHMQVIRFFSLIEFPHSDIHGSLDICSFPWLFAAYHVLLRLLVPRHSPYALSSLTFSLRISFVLLRCSRSKRSYILLYAPLPFELRAPCNTRFYCEIKNYSNLRSTSLTFIRLHCITQLY